MELVSPEALNLLFQKDTLDLTLDDRRAIIRYYRAERARFAKAEAEGKPRGKADNGQKLLDKKPMDLSIEDLDLNL